MMMVAGYPSYGPRVSSDHIKHTHHPLVFMLQDVAVVHAQPLHVLPDLESHRLRRSDVHCVLPGKIRGLGLGPVPLALGDLELCAVQMEWVVHVRWVDHLPQLDLAGFGRQIDAPHFERLAVDKELYSHPASRLGGVHATTGHAYAVSHGHPFAELQTLDRTRRPQLLDVAELRRQGCCPDGNS